MTIFFPVKLRGIGSVDVESFSSYLHRLALCHGVSIRKLLIYTFEYYLDKSKSGDEVLPVFHARGDLTIYVRPNQVTRKTIEVIEFATGNHNLKSSTFLSLESSLNRSVDVFSSRIRWCSDCMAEFREQGDSGYFKLIWHLKSIKHCPTHGTELLDKCPHCGGYQGLYGRRTDAVLCQKCGGSLGLQKEILCHANSWEVESPDLLDLVKQISRKSELNFPSSGVKNIVSYLYDAAWRNEQEDKFWKIIPRNECIGIDSGQIPVTLTNARRIAFRLGVDLVSLLEGTIDQCSDLLDSDWFAHLPREVKPKRRKKPHDRAKIHIAVINLLKRSKKTHPLPLRMVAKEVGVTVGCLQYHFPTLSHKIVEDYRNWHKSELVKIRQRARVEALKFFTDRKNYGPLQSRKAAYKSIRENTGLSKFMLKNEIKMVYDVLS